MAALYSIAERLCLADTIDKHVSKRNQGASVGNYMLIAAINRCIAPKSKRQIADWFASTSLRRWLPMTAPLLACKAALAPLRTSSPVRRTHLFTSVNLSSLSWPQFWG